LNNRFIIDRIEVIPITGVSDTFTSANLIDRQPNYNPIIAIGCAPLPPSHTQRRFNFNDRSDYIVDLLWAEGLVKQQVKAAIAQANGIMRNNLVA